MKILDNIAEGMLICTYEINLHFSEMFFADTVNSKSAVTIDLPVPLK